MFCLLTSPALLSLVLALGSVTFSKTTPTSSESEAWKPLRLPELSETKTRMARLVLVSIFSSVWLPQDLGSNSVPSPSNITTQSSRHLVLYKISMSVNVISIVWPGWAGWLVGGLAG